MFDDAVLNIPVDGGVHGKFSATMDDPCQKDEIEIVSELRQLAQQLRGRVDLSWMVNAYTTVGVQTLLEPFAAPGRQRRRPPVTTQVLFGEQPMGLFAPHSGSTSELCNQIEAIIEAPESVTYFDHCDDIDGRIADDQALARAVRERTPSNTSGEVRSRHDEVLKRL